MTLLDCVVLFQIQSKLCWFGNLKVEKFTAHNCVRLSFFVLVHILNLLEDHIKVHIQGYPVHARLCQLIGQIEFVELFPATRLDKLKAGAAHQMLGVIYSIEAKRSILQYRIRSNKDHI